MGIGLDAVGVRMAPRFLSVTADATEALRTDANWVHNYLFSRSKTIAGGTSEILRGVIARELFGA